MLNTLGCPLATWKTYCVWNEKNPARSHEHVYVFCLGTNMSGSYVCYTAPASSQESAPWPPLGSSSHIPLIPRLPSFLKLVVRFSQRGESIPLATKKSRLNIQELSEHLVFSNFDFRICFPPSGTWKPYESNVGPLKTGPEVCLVYRNSHKKLRKYFQLLRRKVPRSDSACVPVEHPAFSHHFHNLLLYVQSILLSCDLSSKHGSNFIQNFDRCRRSPVWRWKHLQLQRHALVCDLMHHCATGLTEPCRPDDQCDNAIDCQAMSIVCYGISFGNLA